MPPQPTRSNSRAIVRAATCEANHTPIKELREKHVNASSVHEKPTLATRRYFAAECRVSASLRRSVTEHDPRRPALDGVPPSTRASIRAALVRSLVSPLDDDVGELFRVARESASRERVAPPQLVEMIASTWAELAGAAGIPMAERGDRLAVILAHAVASVLAGEEPRFRR
jgi:hypothetical protein